jgi:hypothetical protein
MMRCIEPRSIASARITEIGTEQLPNAVKLRLTGIDVTPRAEILLLPAFLLAIEPLITFAVLFALV